MSGLYLRLIAAVFSVAVVIAGWHALTTHYDHQGYTRAKAEDQAAAEQQAARNRELQRQAEKRYVVQQGIRDRFITQTVKEISVEAAPLADCRVPDSLRMRLDSLRSCALGDPGAPGCPDGSLPQP